MSAILFRSTGLRLSVAIVLCVAGLAGCQHRQEEQPVSIEISHVIGTAPLQLGISFKTAGGDELTIDKLRYYFSNVRLRYTDGRWFANPQSPQKPDGYFLVDEAVPTSKKLVIGPVPKGDYTGIEFVIGVDEARNHSGAQTGALDPAKGMFWTWHSGYIFLWLEGRSPQSPQAEHAVSYHAGGGDIAAPLARTIYMPFGEPLHVRPQLASEIHLDADVAAVFGGSHPLRIADTPEAMEPPAVIPVADGFAGAFRVDHIHNLPRRAGKPLP